MTNPSIARPRHGFLWSALVVVAMIALTGCEDDKPRVGGFCGSDSECPAGQVCFDGQCVGACETSADCDGGAVCEQQLCVQTCDDRAECPLGSDGFRWGCVEERCIPMDAPGVVDAGEPQAIDEGATIVLDAGDGSQPLDPTDAIFSWEIIATQPPDIEIALTEADAADAIVSSRAQLVAPSVLEDTIVSLQLRMEDASGRFVDDTVEVTIRNSVNETPTAVLAEIPTSVESGQEVVVSAADSSDPNPGAVLTYAWEITGAEVAFEDASEAGDLSSIRFVAPEATGITQLTIRVTVSDGTDEATETTTIDVIPTVQPECLTDDDCETGNPCFVSICEGGECLATPGAPDGPCDDGDPCTTEDVCNEEGECAGAPVDCTSEDECQSGTCVGEGECAFVAKPLGAPCKGAFGLCTEQGCLSPSSEVANELYVYGEVELVSARFERLAMRNGNLWATGYGETGFLDGEGGGLIFDDDGGFLHPVTPSVSSQIQNFFDNTEVTDLSEGVAIVGGSAYGNSEGGFGLEDDLDLQLFEFNGGGPYRVWSFLTGPALDPTRVYAIALDTIQYPGATPLVFCQQANIPDAGFTWTCDSNWESPFLRFDEMAVFTEQQDDEYTTAGAVGLVDPFEPLKFDVTGAPGGNPIPIAGTSATSSTHGTILSSEDPTSGKWLAGAPTGCGALEEPCSAVLDWAGIDGTSPDDVWALSADGLLMHNAMAQGWTLISAVGGAEGLADREKLQMEVAGVTIIGGIVWVAAEINARGLDCDAVTGQCALIDANAEDARTQILTGYDPVGQTWLPARELWTADCQVADTDDCGEFLSQSSLGDQAADNDGHLIIVGAAAQKWAFSDDLIQRPLVHTVSLVPSPPKAD